MSSGERPIGAAKGKQSDTQALCHPPPPPSLGVYQKGGGLGGCLLWGDRCMPAQVSRGLCASCTDQRCRGTVGGWGGGQNGTARVGGCMATGGWVGGEGVGFPVF